MNTTITMTTKGTFTLPAALRAKMGVNTKGDKLRVEFDEANQQLVIKRPISLEEINKDLTLYAAKVPPLTDVSGFYRKRKPRI
jgi:bifunctional DNA-binding transcriptional regulator/antitoxin component of YhaV-PrlF toxin-antitoxin module